MESLGQRDTTVVAVGEEVVSLMKVRLNQMQDDTSRLGKRGELLIRLIQCLSTCVQQYVEKVSIAAVGGSTVLDGPDGKRVREAIGVCGDVCGGVARDQSKCGRGTVMPFNNGYVLCTYRSRGENKTAGNSQSAVKMSLLDLGPVMFGDTDEQITWFQSKGLLARNKTCPACNQAMIMQTRSDVSDKYRYIHNHT